MKQNQILLLCSISHHTNVKGEMGAKEEGGCLGMAELLYGISVSEVEKGVTHLGECLD